MTQSERLEFGKRIVAECNANMNDIRKGNFTTHSEVCDEGYERSDEDAPNRIDKDIFGALNFLDTYFDGKQMHFQTFNSVMSWEKAGAYYEMIIYALDNGLPITDPYILRWSEKEPPGLFSRVITKIKDLFGVSRSKK